MRLTLDQYQILSKKTSLYPKVIGLPWNYSLLSLVGSIGKVSEQFSNIMKEQNGILSYDNASELADELGDILYCVSQIATELRIPLNDIAKMNLEKNKIDKERRFLNESGDNE